jgi:hypothetical protein
LNLKESGHVPKGKDLWTGLTWLQVIQKKPGFADLLDIGRIDGQKAFILEIIACCKEQDILS